MPRLFQVQLLFDQELRQPLALVEPRDRRLGGTSQFLGHELFSGEFLGLLDLCNKPRLERLLSSHLPSLPQSTPFELHLLAQLLQLVLLHLPSSDNDHPNRMLGSIVDRLRFDYGWPMVRDNAVDFPESCTSRRLDDFLVQIRFIRNGKPEIGQWHTDSRERHGRVEGSNGMEPARSCIGYGESTKGSSDVGQI